jgi:hypothetical protein
MSCRCRDATNATGDENTCGPVRIIPAPSGPGTRWGRCAGMGVHDVPRVGSMRLGLDGSRTAAKTDAESKVYGVPKMTRRIEYARLECAPIN